MAKWQHFPLAVLITSCGQGGQNQADQLEEPPPLVLAAQSVSLEFPLHFEAGDDPLGYTKVAGLNGRNDTREHLIDALVLCSPDLVWVEKTSHTMAVMMPSEENVIWRDYEGRHPSDEEIIACVKQSVNQPFFYRKVPTGTKTYSQN